MKIILVIEDKLKEQEIAKQVVLDAGYKVVIAQSLEDADRLWKKIDGHIFGILSDMHFPKKMKVIRIIHVVFLC